MDIEERAENEIYLIEQDESMTTNEKRDAIREVKRELIEFMREREEYFGEDMR